jgi:hypothetical protein
MWLNKDYSDTSRLSLNVIVFCGTLSKNDWRNEMTDLNLENLDSYSTTELEKAHRKIGKVLEKRAGGELKQIRKQVQKLAGALGMEITVKADGVLKLESEASETKEELPEAPPAVQTAEETAAVEETPPLPSEEEVTEMERPKKRKASSKQARRRPLKPRRAP